MCRSYFWGKFSIELNLPSCFENNLKYFWLWREFMTIQIVTKKFIKITIDEVNFKKIISRTRHGINPTDGLCWMNKNFIFYINRSLIFELLIFMQVFMAHILLSLSINNKKYRSIAFMHVRRKKGEKFCHFFVLLTFSSLTISCGVRCRKSIKRKVERASPDSILMHTHDE